MQNKTSPLAAEPSLYSMGNDLPRPIGTVRLETASPYFQNTANEVLNSHSACSVDHDANTCPASSPQGTQTGLLGARKTFAVFPEFDAANIEILHAENYGHTAPTSTPVYNAVLRGVQEICVLGGLSDSLKVSLFPSHKVFDAFIQLYFEYFEGLFPIIHKATFNPDDSHWIELLALATVGCRYSKSAVARKCTEAMSEVFRLSIFHTIEIDRLSVRSLWLTRAMVLDVVGTLYSGDKRLMEVGLTILNAVTMQCRHNRYLEASTSNVMTWNVQDEQALHDLWVKWAYEKACRRIACSTWILQCQLGLNFDIPSYMRINELMQPLPYPEDVWEAPDAKTWYSRYSGYAVGSCETSLGSALAAVMRRELIPAAVGGFGRLAMVHAIYHTTFDLRTTLSNPLTVRLLGSSSSEAIALRNWQSRAVELLELLTPLEAPNTTGNIVLMHHSASLTLHSNFITTIHHVSLLSFTPIGDLFLFVSPRSNASEESRARENLLAWICHREGRDARRAVLSACAIFSIIRLRPSQSFHESIPFLMATLTVWAYNHLACIVFHEVTNPPPGPAVTLRLDQVSTAEEAKLWIEKEPGTVRGYLSEVGDIHDHIAGKRLLSVAYQALSTLNTWGLSHGFSNFLKTLLESHYS